MQKRTRNLVSSFIYVLSALILQISSFVTDFFRNFADERLYIMPDGTRQGRMAIQVTYRRTSRLSMRIAKNGDVRVSAPVGLSRKEVERFIDEHRDWIAGARERVLDNQRRRAAFYNQLPLRTKAEADEALQRLKALVEPMAERYSGEMGVKPQGISYKAMISRWGVCNVKARTVCFSAYLLLLPEWCVEHVVVHELCHLLEPSHNARFHALMDRYFPRWKEARRETRRIMNKA